MISNMLNNINLTYLNPIINFLNAWYIYIIGVLCLFGMIYAIILGVNLAKSDSAEKREMSKKRIINASLTIVIIVALTLIMQFVLINLDGWVNNEKTIDSVGRLTDMTIYSDSEKKSKIDITWSWNDDKDTYVIQGLDDTKSVYYVVFKTEKGVSINSNNEYVITKGKSCHGEFSLTTKNGHNTYGKQQFTWMTNNCKDKTL